MSGTDVRTHPAYAALAQSLRDRCTPEELDRFFDVSMQAGQDLFLAAWAIAQQTDPVSVPALTSAILDAAWALCAAHAEDHLVLGETAGIIIGVDERLTQSADGIRRFYYPEWRRMLAEQGGPKRI